MGSSRSVGGRTSRRTLPGGSRSGGFGLMSRRRAGGLVRRFGRAACRAPRGSGPRRRPVVRGDERVTERFRRLVRSSATQAAVSDTIRARCGRAARQAAGGTANRVSTRSRSAARAGRRRRMLPRHGGTRAPRSSTAGTELEHRRGVVDRARERVDEHGRRLASEGANLAEEGILGLPCAAGRAAVEDRRLAGLGRQAQVAAKVRELGEDRREHPVVVEPGLADRDDPRVARRAPRSPPSRRRRPRPRVGWIAAAASRPGNRSTTRARGGRGGVPAGDEDPLDARQPRAPTTASTSSSNGRPGGGSGNRRGASADCRRCAPGRGSAVSRSVLVQREGVALAVGPGRVPAHAGDLRLRDRDRPAELDDLLRGDVDESTRM